MKPLLMSGFDARSVMQNKNVTFGSGLELDKVMIMGILEAGEEVAERRRAIGKLDSFIKEIKTIANDNSGFSAVGLWAEEMLGKLKRAEVPLFNPENLS